MDLVEGEGGLAVGDPPIGAVSFSVEAMAEDWGRIALIRLTFFL